MSAVRLETFGPQGFGTYACDLTAGTREPVDGLSEGFLVPGFVDIHIHGAFGIDVMSANSDDLLTMADRLSDIGYEAFLPTTVTHSREVIEGVLSQIPDDPRMPGFHLEGPFLSPKHPGAQPPSYIISFTEDWSGIVDDPRMKVITLAPEIERGLELTARLNERGVVVSLGHTDATYAQVGEAIEAGARHTTHTYNAMRPLHHREAGTVGAALNRAELTCELIYDRIHVSRPAAEVLIRAKGPEGIIAVSDATMAAGMPPGTQIKMWGLDCLVGNKQVRLLDGTLAGSGINLLDAFRNLTEDFGAELAMRATSLNPRRAIGHGAPKVWIVMDNDLQIKEIRRTSSPV